VTPAKPKIKLVKPAIPKKPVHQRGEIEDFRTKELKLEATRRGTVLIKLKQAYPNACSVQYLFDLLKRDYRDCRFNQTNIQQTLAYLAECGLVKTTPDFQATITVQGLNYLQGLGQDIQGVWRG
jgi:hypothetical protein